MLAMNGLIVPALRRCFVSHIMSNQEWNATEKLKGPEERTSESVKSDCEERKKKSGHVVILKEVRS